MSEKRMLVVDDNSIVRDVLEKVASRRGIEVVTTNDGRKAKETLKNDAAFDLIILDLLMPDVSGWDVLEWVKSNPTTSHLPVAVLSGAGISQDEKDKLVSKTVGFFDKESFSLKIFDRFLDEVLV